jgi:hypothetical protein
MRIKPPTWRGLDMHHIRGAVRDPGYPNFFSEGVDTDTMRAASGPDRYDRVVALARRMDPTNLLHLNQSIRP